MAFINKEGSINLKEVIKDFPVKMDLKFINSVFVEEGAAYDKIRYD